MPGVLPSPDGKSLWRDVSEVQLTGHYWRLRTGTVLPPGLAVVADGLDVLQSSKYDPGHHTLYNTEIMSVEIFTRLLAELPWEYGGKKPR
jgi:hypothetical protein